MRKKFTLTEQELKILKNNLIKSNKKIAKWNGFPPITFKINSEYFVSRNDDLNYTTYKIKKFDIEIIGEIPHFEGWEFVSCLEFDRLNKCVFINALNNKYILPEKFINKKSIGCDHCGHKRFRTKSFIIYNSKENKWIEVGSSCLKKFFEQNVSKLVSFVNTVMDMDEEKFRGNRSDNYYIDTLGYLICTKYCIDKSDWVSVKNFKIARERADINNTVCKIEATKDSAIDFCHSIEQLKIKNSQIIYTKKVIEFFKTYDPDNNDYMINICQIAKCEYIMYKKMGIAASIFVAYENLNIERKTKEKIETNYVGKIGERLKDIKAVVTFRKDFQNSYGVSTLYKFKDNVGNIISSFYSGCKVNLDIDDSIILAGTVKKHDKFRDEKQTMLTRIIVND